MQSQYYWHPSQARPGRGKFTTKTFHKFTTVRLPGSICLSEAGGVYFLLRLRSTNNIEIIFYRFTLISSPSRVVRSDKYQNIASSTVFDLLLFLTLPPSPACWFPSDIYILLLDLNTSPSHSSDTLLAQELQILHRYWQ